MFPSQVVSRANLLYVYTAPDVMDPILCSRNTTRGSFCCKSPQKFCVCSQSPFHVFISDCTSVPCAFVQGYPRGEVLENQAGAHMVPIFSQSFSIGIPFAKAAARCQIIRVTVAMKLTWRICCFLTRIVRRRLTICRTFNIKLAS